MRPGLATGARTPHQINTPTGRADLVYNAPTAHYDPSRTFNPPWSITMKTRMQQPVIDLNERRQAAVIAALAGSYGPLRQPRMTVTGHGCPIFLPDGPRGSSD
jgi:hypothetical protein